MSVSHRVLLGRCSLTLWFALGGCGDENAGGGIPSCLEQAANAECTERTYPPADDIAYTFGEIYPKTLSTRGCLDRACHDSQAPAGGLDMSDETTAYASLLDASAERIHPGDVQCGKLIVVLETPGQPYSMPRGGHLNETDLCVLRQWIAAGALP